MMCLLGVIEITDFTPLIMVIPSIEEEVEEIEEEENGYKKGQCKDLMAIPIGDMAKIMVCRPPITTSTSVPQSSRQDDEWSVPPNS